MADKKVGYTVFRKYKGVLESHIDKKFYGVVDAFYDEGILTEEQKTTALDKDVALSLRISNLKKIMREKAQESDAAFEAILRAFRSIEGVDMKTITTNFDQEKKKSVVKRKSTSSESASVSASHTITLQTSPVSAQDGPVSVPEARSIALMQNARTYIDHFPRLGNLPTIPASPIVPHKTHDNEESVEFDPPIDQEVVAPPPGTEVAAEQENAVERRLTRPSRTNRTRSLTENEMKTEQQQIQDLLTSVVEVTHTEEELKTKLRLIQTKHAGLVDFYEDWDAQFGRVQTESRRSSLQSSSTIKQLERNIEDIQNLWDYDKKCADTEIESLGDSWQKESFDNVLQKEEMERLHEELKVRKSNIEQLAQQLRSEQEKANSINRKLRAALASNRNETLNKIGRQLLRSLSSETREETDQILRDIEISLIRLRGRPSTTGGAIMIKYC